MRTREVEAHAQAVAARFKAEIPEAFDGDGVSYLQTVYKDPTQPVALRMNAAALASKYERPALTKEMNPAPAVAVNVEVNLVDDPRPSLDVFIAEFMRRPDAPVKLSPPTVDVPVEAPRPRLPNYVADDVAQSRARDSLARQEEEKRRAREARLVAEAAAQKVRDEELARYRGVGPIDLDGTEFPDE